MGKVPDVLNHLLISLKRLQVMESTCAGIIIVDAGTKVIQRARTTDFRFTVTSMVGMV
jgi:hypothetical protein